MLFAVALIGACVTQSILRSATPPRSAESASLTAPWAGLGERRTLGASALWAQTVSAYANRTLDPSHLPRRIAVLHQLDPTDPEPARLAVAMMHTLPGAEPEVEARLLRDSALVHTDDAWFPTALAVGMHRGELPGTADQAANWMSRAAGADPRLVAAARRMQP